MSWMTFFAILAFVAVIAGLLFLSLIHLFMIPKDVMKRDIERQRHLEGQYEEELRAREAARDTNPNP